MVEIVQRHPTETRLRDAKLAEVKRSWATDLHDQKVLMFSYYHDTAAYVYRAFDQRHELEQAHGRAHQS